MELDLEKVRVTYTLREVIAAIAMLLTLATHVVRTELQHNADAQQIVSLRTDVDACKHELESSKARAGR